MVERSTATPASLVLRYHSLGDVVLTTGVLRELSRETGAPVEVVTEARFRCLFAGLPWVQTVHDRAAAESPADFSAPTSGYSRIVDLQGTPGSRRTARRLAGSYALPEAAPVRSLARYGWQRRWFVLYGDRWPRPKVPHAVERYAETCHLPATAPEDPRWHPELLVQAEERAAAHAACPELAPWLTGLGQHRNNQKPLAALVVGASRRSKAYPAERLSEVAARLCAEGWQVAWVDDPQRGIPAPPQTIPVSVPLPALKAVLGSVDLAICSDSGPMHMAAALGIPVVAIFASSVRAFGFSPLGSWTRVLEVDDLACRPCGVHGRNGCWIGHWRCQDIPPATVVQAAQDLYNAAKTSFGAAHASPRVATVPAEEPR